MLDTLCSERSGRNVRVGWTPTIGTKFVGKSEISQFRHSINMKLTSGL